ncbi:hypothetical protein KKG48_01915 [Patescibacteria group bacterium]|nr:hypothetical protein [Patescibacteria group bacterium]MCG2694467.1 hypothetical protein [Candidatus Parcubacteria bacterium]
MKLNYFEENKVVIYILVVVALVLAGWFFYQKQNEEFKIITDEGEMTRFVMNHSQEEVDEYWKKVDELKVQDTFGGKTPEETLQLYIDALKSGDIELASKYFRLEDQEGELIKLGGLEAERINKYVDILQNYNFKKCNSIFDVCSFRGLNDNVVVLVARLVKIEKSELWKLESF